MRRSALPVIVVAAAVFVAGSPASAQAAASVRAPLTAVTSIITDGSPVFDTDDTPGNDSDALNGIVRTNDNVQYNFQYNFSAGGADDPVIRSVLPAGMTWTLVPPDCSGGGTPASGIYDSNGTTLGGNRRTLICQLPTTPNSTSGRITPTAFVGANGLKQGDVLNVGFSLDDSTPAAPVASNSVPVTVSAAPQYDLVKGLQYNAVSVQPSVPGPNGPEPGVRIGYTIGVKVHNTSPRTDPNDRRKGVAPLGNLITFADDISGVSPNARLQGCGGISSTFIAPNSSGGGAHGVPYSGAISCTQNGSTVDVRIANANTGAEQIPSDFGGDPYVISLSMALTIPNSDLEKGADGVVGTPDDGFLTTNNVYTGFDPDSAAGVSNYGAGTEPLANNRLSQFVSLNRSIGPPLKRFNADRVTTDFVAVATVQSTNNNQVPATQIDCDVFDPTAFRLAKIPGATVPARAGGAAAAFRLEYGNGAATSTSVTQLSTQRCADGDAVWKSDPTDAALGAALTPDGYRDGIDRVRVVWTQPLANVGHAIDVGLRVLGKSALTETNNGLILPNFGQKQTDGGTWAGSRANLVYVLGNVAVTKDAVPAGSGTGNHYLVGSQIRYSLQPTVTVAGTAPGPVKNVQVTDILPATTPRLTVIPSTVTNPSAVKTVEYCDACDGTDWTAVPPATPHGVRWSFGDVLANTTLPKLGYSAQSDIDAPNGTQYINQAVASSPDDDRPVTSRADTATIILDAPSTVLVSKTTEQSIRPVDSDLVWKLTTRNNTATDLNRADAIDVLPYNGDGRTPASAFSGGFTDIKIAGTPSNTIIYVSSATPASLDAADGTVDGHADPLNPGDQGYVQPGTGAWACMLAQVGTSGCPAVNQVTALRVFAAAPRVFPAGSSFALTMTLTPQGNKDGDVYTNRFVGRVEKSQLALPVYSPDVPIVVTEPHVAIAKQACTRPDPDDCDPADDGLWAETATVANGGDGVFRVKVTNTGTQPGTISVTDAVPAGLTYVAGSAKASAGDVTGFPDTWNAGIVQSQQSATLTFRVTLPATTTAPIANTASAHITDTFNQTDDATDPASIGSTPPKIGVLKKVAKNTDVNTNGKVDAGDTLAFEFTVTNTGTIPLNGITVTDAKIGAVTCPKTALAAGESTVCTGDAAYTITQADVNAGSVGNTATATGTPPTGPPVTSTPSVTSTPTSSGPNITLAKTAVLADTDRDGFADVGETITYGFEVTNDGTVTLTDVTVTDVKAGTVTCPAGDLPPAGKKTCTAEPYTVTQADVDAGKVHNSATATGTPPTGPPVTSTPATADTPTPATTNGITVTKTATLDGTAAAGQTITYSFEVTNTGTATLTSVAVTDAKVGTVTCPVTTLAPGAKTTCTAAKYTITQADADAGKADNSAIADGRDPANKPVTSPPSTTSTPIPASPALTLAKTANPATVSAAGQKVTYSYEVTNTGNVTVTGLKVTDTAFTGSGTAPVPSCPAAPLAPGAKTTCTATYTITQADLDEGKVDNTATATGKDPKDTDVTTPPSTATVTAAQTPKLTLVKSAADSTGSAVTQLKTGGRVVYTFLVTNTGNVTVDSLAVTDTAFTGTGAPPVVTCPKTVLAPGEKTACTGDYTLTQADVDRADLDNTASATGTTKNSTPARSNDSKVELPATSAPALTLVKEADTATAKRGQKITYTFKVTNTGNVTLNKVKVSEKAFTGSGRTSPVSCPATPLAPGATLKCTASYTVTTADAGAGSVTNTATATGTPTTGTPPVSPPSTTTVRVTGIPAPAPARLVIAKKANKTKPLFGSKLTYTITIRNVGRTDRTGVKITDGLSRVLDDATFKSAKASGGRLTRKGSVLTWTGTVKKGRTVTITYTVKINRSGDRKLVNTVTGPALSNCTAASNRRSALAPTPACTAKATVRKPKEKGALP